MKDSTKIEFNDRHINLLISSLECFMRLRLKQWRYALEAVFPESWKELADLEYGQFENKYNQIDRIFSNLPYTKSKEWNEIYSIYQLLRQYISYKRNDWKKGFGVNFDSPDVMATAPLPKIEGWDSKNGIKLNNKE